MNSDIPVQALSSSSISLCQVSTWPKLCKHNSSQPRNPQNLSCRTLPLPFSVLFNHQMFYLLKQLEMFISVFSTSPIFSLSFFILIHNLSHIHTQIPVKMLSSYYLFPPKFHSYVQLIVQCLKIFENICFSRLMVSFSVRENLYTIALLCLEAYDYIFFSWS